MPRIRHPRLGRYVPEYERVAFKGKMISVKSCTYNGTVRNYKRWRKRRMKMQDVSRKANR